MPGRPGRAGRPAARTTLRLCAALSNDHGRLREDGVGDSQPRGLGCLEVDHEVELGRLLDGDLEAYRVVLECTPLFAMTVEHIDFLAPRATGRQQRP